MYFCGRGCFVAVDGTQPCRRPLRVLGAFWIPVPRSALLCFGGRGGRGAPMMSAAFAGAWSILDPRAQVSPPMLWWARGARGSNDVGGLCGCLEHSGSPCPGQPSYALVGAGDFSAEASDSALFRPASCCLRQPLANSSRAALRLSSKRLKKRQLIILGAMRDYHVN